jgi:hypothetical protein
MRRIYTLPPMRVARCCRITSVSFHHLDSYDAQHGYEISSSPKARYADVHGDVMTRIRVAFRVLSWSSDLIAAVYKRTSYLPHTNESGLSNSRHSYSPDGYLLAILQSTWADDQPAPVRRPSRRGPRPSTTTQFNIPSGSRLL